MKYFVSVNGSEHVVDHWTAGDPMENLGKGGLHAGALAGGKDDGESRGLGHAGLGRCRFTPWRSSKKRAPEGWKGVGDT